MLENWLFALLGVPVGVAVVVGYRLWRRRRIAARRRVEAPNSTFNSALVQQGERRQRWSAIGLNRLHPVNRAEVQRLLHVVTEAGVAALSESERTFLDHLADITRR